MWIFRPFRRIAEGNPNRFELRLKRRFFSTEDFIYEEVDVKSPTKKERLRKRIATVENVATSMKISDQTHALLSRHTNKLAKSMKQPEGIYILDKSLAAIIIKYLSMDLRKETGYVYELNPGPGCVTQAILEAGAPNVRVFEKRKEFLPYLQDLKDEYEDRLEIVEENFFTIQNLHYKYPHFHELFFKDVQFKCWGEDPPFKIFAVVPTLYEVPFLRHIISRAVSFESLFMYGRTELLLFVSDKEYRYITAQPRDPYLIYRSVSVLYQILFDIDILHQEPRSSFFPPPSTEISERSLLLNDSMYLIRLKPKQFLFELISPDLIGELVFFIRHHFLHRTAIIAPALDAWIPESSSRLEEQGINSKMMFGQLTAAQMFTLFLHFSSWPEYKDSVFRRAAHKMIENVRDFDDPDDQE